MKNRITFCRRSRVLTPFILAGAVLARPPVARAVDFYAVDMNFDHLRIISSTGQNTDVGPLNLLVTDVDLAYLNGHLYALDSVSGSSARLLEINTTTGAATVLAGVTEGSSFARGADSLAVRGGSLWAGYSLDNQGISTHLGPLPLSGVINPASSVTTTIDLDSLAWNGTAWRSVDVNAPSPGSSTLYTGSGATFISLATASNSVLAMNDLDYDGTDLWGMRTVDEKLVRIDPDTGAVLQTVTFPTNNGIFTNLAAIPLPEPGAVLAVAAIVPLIRRRTA